jgi:outer membrane autotransporter protein
LHSGSAGRAKFHFTTAGISFGVDDRLNDQLTVGAGVGYGRDSSRIGGDGSKVEADNYVGAVYGSYRPGHNAFVDVVVGYGDLEFDTRRFVAADNAFASGQRRGWEALASVTGGYDFRRGPLSLSTYGRLDSISGALDAYTESEAGGGANALSFDRQSLSVLTSTLGLHGAYTVRVVSWLWSPHLRLEYRYDLETAGLASLQYANDLAGPTYSRAADPLNRNQFSAEFGTDLRLRTMSFGLDYRADIQGREEFVHQIIGKFALRF